MKRLILIFLIGLLLASTVKAASIQGEIYDFSLTKLNNLIVEINTEPTQRQIAKDGSYTFNIPQGNYTIIVKDLESKTLASENITINEEGNYNLDIITFFDIEEQELLNDTDIDLTTEIEEVDQQKNNWLTMAIIIIVLILLVGLFYLITKHKRKEQKEDLEDNLTNKVLEVIKKEGGRITQKELRKNFPYSEAKISLVITELESKGQLEKIKKGRSNVIILKKN